MHKIIFHIEVTFKNYIFSLPLILHICIPQQSILVEVRGFLKLHWLRTNKLPQTLNLKFKGTSELRSGGKRFKRPRQTLGP